jgi:3-methyladenine DNA glycosylase/8-oxoguanine DNA glycosylase
MPGHAIDHLRRCDDRLGEWIDRIGQLQLPVPEAREPYVALLETIAHQQLAGAAARSIWARVIGLFEEGVPCPRRLVDMPEEHLRSAGLSRSKAMAMRDICAKVNAGKIPDAVQIKLMSDTDIYALLTDIRGVGSWTVDMLMMFTLCRPDIMPVTDYGVRKGFQVLYRKRKLPTPKQLEKFSEKWRPHRSVAALYLWRIADTAKKKKSLPK